MASTRVPKLTRALVLSAAACVALAGCGGNDDEPAAKAPAPKVELAPEPSSPPTEGSAKAKAITVNSTCGEYTALSVKDRDAAAFYVTKKADTNQAGFPQWRKLLDQWCDRKEVKNSTKLILFLEPFKKSNTPEAGEAAAAKARDAESGK